jgi:RNA polymerase sigma-70 factor (ECF subfamily)
MDDVEIIRKFKHGEAAAFNDIVLKYQDRIFNLCLYMLRDTHDAQDAAQDSFIKACRALHDFSPDASLYTWIYRIAMNTCLDYRRKRIQCHMDSHSIAEDMPSLRPSPERLYESKEISDSVRSALQKIPEKLRATIVLRELDGLSYEEIAEILDISTGTVKSRISRAREELRRLLHDKF